MIPAPAGKEQGHGHSDAEGNGEAAAAIVAVAAGLLISAAGGRPQATGAAAPAAPKPCVATVLPDTHYQAIAELNACTGRGITLHAPLPGIPWAVALLLPLPGNSVIIDP